MKFTSTMDRRWTGFIIYLLLFSLTAAYADVACPPFQKLVTGTRGIVRCSFEERFFGIFWYNSTKVLHQDAIVVLRDSEKSGPGYSAKEFDLDDDGSLIIYNVTKQHERNFTVLFLKTTTDVTVRHNINVVVNSNTFTPVPRIDKCSATMEVCFKRWNGYTEACYIEDARFVIPVIWMERTIDGDRNISSVLSVTNKSSFYTSTVTTANPFVFSPYLVLLVCKAYDSMELLQKNMSLVLLLNGNINPTSVNVLTDYVQIGSQMKLKCKVRQSLFLLWQIKRPSQDEDSPILYTVLTENGFSHKYNDDYNLEDNGSLAVFDIRVKHEGLYSCVSGDGKNDHVVRYNIVVYALPVPSYPVIEGCNHKQYCVLEVQREGSLSCTLTGIRPCVQLDFRTFPHRSLQMIEFFDKHLITNDNDGAFDVSLTSKYRVKKTEFSTITIECQVVGTEIGHLHLSTKFDILSMTVFSRRQGINSYNRQESRNHEMKDIYSQNSPEEALPMLEQMSLQEKQHLFITQLQSKYQDLYEAVQPVPYIRDRLYCVNRVFVEGGIEYFSANDKIGGHGTWQSLDTYQNILNDPRVKSVRRILEGEPGYGKSTLTLQLAYDWCNKISTYSLCNADVFILLRFRQLGGVTSVYRAIKQFLLPIDSTLSESDIKTIISNSSHVVVVLDGFDEYPDQDSGHESDVISIIKKKMFQQFEVIVTTRSSFLPKDYPPQTKRIKLTGFDDRARDQYIQKAVVDDDLEAAEKIKRRLKDNAVLTGLCQVPLFFVMFAHMSHESDHFQRFNSVTSFFRYMISCFHSHMKNKFKDENVTKFNLFETEHHKLDKIAFEGLKGKEQQIVWKKEELCERLGQEFYSQYTSIGILVEEEVLTITDKPSALITEHVQYNTEVRFYHKLFCEWYAAHYLSGYASKDDVTFKSNDAENRLLSRPLPREPNIKSNAWNTDPFLRHFDPINVQFLYRFACGLNPVAGKKIIEYLKKSKEGEKFAILCILEQEGNAGDLLETVRHLCSTKLQIGSSQNLLLQRSTIQLLEIACSSELKEYEEAKQKTPKIKRDDGSIVRKLEEKLQEIKVYRQAYHGRSFVGNHVHKCCQKENIDKLMAVAPDVVGSLCPQLLPEANTISTKYRTLFRLFSVCHKQINACSVLSDEDIQSLELTIKGYMTFSAGVSR